MTTKERLHQLVDDLPEGDLPTAERVLAALRATSDPVARALAAAPVDDEPETEEERREVEEAREELARGELHPLEEVKRELRL